MRTWFLVLVDKPRHSSEYHHRHLNRDALEAYHGYRLHQSYDILRANACVKNKWTVEQLSTSKSLWTQWWYDPLSSLSNRAWQRLRSVMLNATWTKIAALHLDAVGPTTHNETWDFPLQRQFQLLSEISTRCDSLRELETTNSYC